MRALTAMLKLRRMKAVVSACMKNRYMPCDVFNLFSHVNSVVYFMSTVFVFLYCLLQQVKFNWGTGAITPYGRDYVSAQWMGKLKGPSTETFTIYLRADDAARLYIDHELVIDAWEGNFMFWCRYVQILGIDANTQS